MFEIFNYIKCNDCNPMNDLLCTCLNVNICKSVSSGDAKLKERVNLPKFTKSVAHTSSNVIFDEMQTENDRSNLSNVMTESPNNLMET